MPGVRFLRGVVAAMALLTVAGPAAAQQSKAENAVHQAMAACPGQVADKAPCEQRFFDACSARGGDSTMAMVECESRLAGFWDSELNRVYGRLMETLEPAARDALRQTQRTWLTWRDARCQPWGYVQGTMYRIVGAGCFTDTVRTRVADLEDLLDAIGG